MNILKLPIFLLPLGLVLAALTILPQAQGQVIYTNGFETNQNYFTNGGTGSFGSIAGQGTDGGAIKNWTATFSSGTALIVTSSTTNSTMYPASGDQMLQAQYGTGTLSLNQVIRPTNNTITESFNYTFQLALQEDAVSNAGVYIGIRSSAAAAAGNLNGLDFGVLRYSDGGGGYEYGFAVRQSNPGGPSYATRVGTNTFTINEWHTFNLDFDRDTLTFSGSVLDSSNNLVTSFANVAIWDRDGVMSGYGFDQLGVYIHQKGGQPHVLVDDMSLALIGDYYWAPSAGGGGTGIWSSTNTNWAAAAGTNGTGTQSQYGTLIFRDTAGTITVSNTVHVAKGLRFATNGYTLTGDDISLDGDGIGFNTIRTDTGVTATINSKLAGTNGCTKAGSGTLVLGGANTYTGGTAVFEGELAGTTTSLQGNIANDASLTFSQTTNGTYSGAISGGGILKKTGAGTVTFAGTSANTQSGKTTVDGGTLELAKTAGVAAISGNLEIKSGATLLLSANNQVANTSAVTLSGGTIARGSGVSEVFGNLNLTAASSIDYGAGATGTLQFGTYTPSSLLTVSSFLEGNKLVFGSNLTSDVTNSSKFSFDNGFTSSWDGSTFTITAIPEPSVFVAAAGLLGLLLWPLRIRTRGTRSA